MVSVAKKQAKILEVQINTNAQLLTKEKARKLCHARLDRIIISADGITKETYEKIRINASWERLIDNVAFLSQLPSRPIIRIQTCELPENAEEIGEFTDFWAQYADEIRIWQSFDPLKKKDPRLKRRLKTPCPQLWQRLVVAWNGDVHPCCVDWTSKGVLGNVKEKPLKEIWDSPKERYLRHLHKFKIAGICEPCSSCDNFII
jgi:radical SAM protein with 4Fe4S-binding SPASM domain